MSLKFGHQSVTEGLGATLGTSCFSWCWSLFWDNMTRKFSPGCQSEPNRKGGGSARTILIQSVALPRCPVECFSSKLFNSISGHVDYLESDRSDVTSASVTWSEGLLMAEMSPKGAKWNENGNLQKWKRSMYLIRTPLGIASAFNVDDADIWYGGQVLTHAARYLIMATADTRRVAAADDL